MHGKAAYRHVLSRVVRQSKVSCYRLRSMFLISFDVTQMATQSSCGFAEVYILA